MPDKQIDTWQIFGSFLLLLISYVVGIIAWLRRDMKKLKNKLEERTLKTECKDYRADCEKDCIKSRDLRDKYIEKINNDATDSCEKVHSELLKTAHKHASLGSAGEVIK